MPQDSSGGSDGSTAEIDGKGRSGVHPASPSTSRERNWYKCSFCYKLQEEVARLIAGPNQVYICDECVWHCNQILADGLGANSLRLRDLKEAIEVQRAALGKVGELVGLAYESTESMSPELPEQLVGILRSANEHMREFILHEFSLENGEVTPVTDN